MRSFLFFARETREITKKKTDAFVTFVCFVGNIIFMLKVLTAEQMREIDRLTTERYGIPSILLMENAAQAVARVVTEKLGGSVKDKSILVLCGKGNNGGDGAAIGRLLSEDGAEVSVELFGSFAETKRDARLNFERLASLQKVTLKEVRAELDDNGVDGWMDNSDYDVVDVVVDALFGTGLTRKLDGFFLEQIEILNKWKRIHKRPIYISVDLASGLDADSHDVLGAALRADATVTFTAPKIANILPPSCDINGELFVEDIGSPQELIDEQPSQMFVTEKSDAAEWLQKSRFTNDSYKNKRGHALVIAGSESYSGAAVLGGNAAMRSGVGLVTIATPRSSKDSVASRVLPEVMVRGVAETENGSISEDAFEEAKDLLEKADSVAIGSGISQDESTKSFVQRVVKNRRQPTIIDADALNLLSPFAANGESREPLILTPHEGEFMRLLGTDDKEAIKDRVAAVRDFATKHNVILVLKGERVLIGEPGGKVVVNPTGNAGLGKAGNGDTLTGILTGFAAQSAKMEIDIFETVVAAVYVAGMAGDIAEQKYGKRVMTASDVRECLTEVFDKLERNSI